MSAIPSVHHSTLVPPNPLKLREYSSLNPEDRQPSLILNSLDLKWGDSSYIGVPTRSGDYQDTRNNLLTSEIEFNTANIKFHPDMITKQKDKNREIYNILKNIRESAFKKDNKDDPAFVRFSDTSESLMP